MLTSPEARSILFERMVPRYQDRHFHFTRILNQQTLRIRDGAKMAYIEYVDRPGEFRPANPVGAARVQFVAQEFLATRRGRRAHMAEMQRILSWPTIPLDEGVLEQCRLEASKAEALLALEAST